MFITIFFECGGISTGTRLRVRLLPNFPRHVPTVEAQKPQQHQHHHQQRGLQQAPTQQSDARLQNITRSLAGTVVSYCLLRLRREAAQGRGRGHTMQSISDRVQCRACFIAPLLSRRDSANCLDFASATQYGSRRASQRVRGAVYMLQHSRGIQGLREHKARGASCLAASRRPAKLQR